jgi:hypothetical protein
VLLTALLSVLENVSYTRKDGQYLRWDHRAGRRHGIGTFEKSDMQTFDTAITAKLSQVMKDLEGFRREPMVGTDHISLLEGSCLDVLPQVRSDSYDVVLTSPPYCNRYDYTRTYALELALLGCGAEEFKRLRQRLLSSTVENRPKMLSEVGGSCAKLRQVGPIQNRAYFSRPLVHKYHSSLYRGDPPLYVVWEDRYDLHSTHIQGVNVGWHIERLALVFGNVDIDPAWHYRFTPRVYAEGFPNSHNRIAHGKYPSDVVFCQIDHSQASPIWTVHSPARNCSATWEKRQAPHLLIRDVHDMSQ